MKKIKVRRTLSFRSHSPEERTWPQREDAVREGVEDEGGGEAGGVREPRVDPPEGPGSGEERAIPPRGD